MFVVTHRKASKPQDHTLTVGIFPSDHFNQPNFQLMNDNFEFPDLLGPAYEYLIKFFADSEGKKGAEFYIPAEVVRLLM